MTDFTKFKLKSKKSLIELVKDKENFLILACNKCFKKFSLDDEPEYKDVLALLTEQGKNIANCIKVDFLCNKTRAINLLSTLDFNYNNILTISCGLGVQTIGSIADTPVYTSCDSVAPKKFTESGEHSMALSSKLCAGCGDCVLGETGGICPTVDCAKSLRNGECGGASNGKCEVNKDMDCGWARIYERTKKVSFFDILARSSSHHITHTIAPDIRKKRLDGFVGGVYIKGCKEFSDSKKLIDLPFIPEFVTIPMSQHKGMSAEPIVMVGDHVKIGQKIGEAVGTMSSSIHSSVSGIVTAIESCNHPNLSSDTLAIIIKSDGKNEIHNSVRPINYWEDLDIHDIDAIIAEKGIVGMGGAGFPTPIKLKSAKPIKTILINGCESEPYITADHRIMLEYSNELLEGLKIILKSTGADKVIIVIGNNKADAIELLSAKVSEFENVSVFSVAPKYPQGSEKMLMQRVLGFEPKHNERPHDYGVIVLNVSTTKAIGDAFLYGMPLISRAVTVTGDICTKHGNYIVPIGTSVKDILRLSGALDENGNLKSQKQLSLKQDSKLKSDIEHIKPEVILGGPMMGYLYNDFDTPIIKGTHGILIQNHFEFDERECVRCGRCVDVCPVKLLPLYYSPLTKISDYQKLENYDIFRCIECGCCDYICPSKIKIRDTIKVSKKNILSKSG